MSGEEDKRTREQDRDDYQRGPGIARAFAEAYVRDEGGGGRPPAFLGRRKLKPDVTGTLLWFGGSVEVIDNEHVWQGPYRTCIKPIRILAAVSSHVAPNRVGLFSA
jgi:hypothetical protein